MKTFEQFYKLFEMKLAHSYAKHTTTHTGSKPQIIQNENDFINRYITNRSKEEIIIGVVGNPKGWQAHVNQYIQLGFIPENMIICEYDFAYFSSLLARYTKMFFGIIPFQSISPRSIHTAQSFYDKIRATRMVAGVGFSMPKKFRNEEEQSYKNVEGINIIKAKEQPTLAWGEISSTGEILFKETNSTRDLKRIHPEYNKLVTHIDLDITSVKDAEYIINQNNMYYNNYTQLKSLVQTHSLRGINLYTPTETHQVDVRWNDEMYDELFNIVLKYPPPQVSAWANNVERMKGSLKSIVRRAVSENHQSQAVIFANIIRNGLIKSHRTGLIQLYTGAGNVTTMVSIASIKNPGDVTINIHDVDFGATDIVLLTTLRNHIIRIQNLPRTPDNEEDLDNLALIQDSLVNLQNEIA